MLKLEFIAFLTSGDALEIPLTWLRVWIVGSLGLSGMGASTALELRRRASGIKLGVKP